MQLPKSWNDVYVDQYVELVKLNDKELSITERNLEILSILTDTMPDDDIWEEYDVEELIDMMNSLSWVMKSPSNDFSKSILGLSCIDINNISLGEYIDIDSLCVDIYSNLPKICSILYRKTNNDKWGNIEYEPYGIYDIDKRAEVFNEVSINDVFGIVRYFLSFKELITKSYELLFEPEFDEGDDEEYDEFDLETEKEIEDEKKFKKWSWEMVLHKLSNGDITKYDDILKKPIIFIFNQLSFQKDMKI